MSVQAMVWALAQQDFTEGGRTNHAAKLILVALANHAGTDDTLCWPSMDTIAREASCTPRHIRRLLPDLQANGFITIKRRRGAGGRQGSNLYKLLIDRTPAPWKFQSDTTSPRPQSDPTPLCYQSQSDVGSTSRVTPRHSATNPRVTWGPLPE